MITLLRKDCAIFERNHIFWVAVGGRTLEFPFSSYRDAYAWLKRLTNFPFKAKWRRDEY